MIKYKHTQIGYLMLFVLFLIVIINAIAFMYSGFDLIATFIIILVFIIVLSFVSLTVTIDTDNLSIKFGYGIYKKQFKLAEITSAKIVKNHWYYGWGIRWWSGVWIYNVSGFDAVEITMRDGKIYRIGTDDSMELESKINMEIKH